MPEYAFAIDLYGRESRHVYVQEYAPPKSVNQESARERRREALAVLPEVLSVPLPQRAFARAQTAEGRGAVREARQRGASATRCRKGA